MGYVFCVQHIQNMHLSCVFHCSWRHTASRLLTVSSVCCLANSLQGCGREGCTKEKPTFLLARRNTPTYKHDQRFGYQQVLEYHNSDLFKRVAEQMKEEAAC